MVTMHPQLVFSLVAMLPAGVAVFFDLRERRIPNLLTGPTLLAGLSLHAGFGGWPGLGSSATAALFAGILFFAFFLAGGMGAGDVKLMAAIGAVVGLPGLESSVLGAVFFGAFGAIVLSAYHGKSRETLANVCGLLLHHSREGLRPHPVLNLGNKATLRLPFAVPIAFGCVFTSVLTAWSTH